MAREAPGLRLVAIAAAASVLEAAEREPGIQEHSLEAVRIVVQSMRDVALQAADDAEASEG